MIIISIFLEFIEATYFIFVLEGRKVFVFISRYGENSLCVSRFHNAWPGFCISKMTNGKSVKERRRYFHKERTADRLFFCEICVKICSSFVMHAVDRVTIGMLKSELGLKEEEKIEVKLKIINIVFCMTVVLVKCSVRSVYNALWETNMVLESILPAPICSNNEI